MSFAAARKGFGVRESNDIAWKLATIRTPVNFFRGGGLGTDLSSDESPFATGLWLGSPLLTPYTGD